MYVGSKGDYYLYSRIRTHSYHTTYFSFLIFRNYAGQSI